MNRRQLGWPRHLGVQFGRHPIQKKMLRSGAVLGFLQLKNEWRWNLQEVKKIFLKINSTVAIVCILQNNSLFVEKTISFLWIGDTLIGCDWKIHKSYISFNTRFFTYFLLYELRFFSPSWVSSGPIIEMILSFFLVIRLGPKIRE